MTVSSSYPTTLDAASAGPRPLRRSLEGRRDVDACVVGGGFTGLATAIALAERGYSVALLEAERVGHGASGRSGGQLWSGHRRGVLELEALYGRDAARALWGLADESRALLAARMAPHRIRCDAGAGTLLAAARRRHVEALRIEAEHLARWYGQECEFLGRAEVCEAVATRRYHGGLYDPQGGHVHPLGLALGLAAAAEEAGVQVFERSPVEHLDWNLRTQVVTPQGTVRARYVLLCAHLSNARLVPALAPQIVPIASAQVATERLEAAGDLIPAGCCVCSTDVRPEYFRLTVDGRLVFGAGERFGTRTLRDPVRLARRRLVGVFPQLADVRIEHRWYGHVAVTRDRLPRFGRVAPNGFYAHGFCGHGVVLSQIAGQLLAEAVAGEAGRFELLASLPVRTFAALGPLTRPLAFLVLLAQALRGGV